MENWIIGTKFIVLLYCILKYIMGNMDDLPYVLLFILLYICINILIYVFKRTLYKRSMLISACILPLFLFMYNNSLFIFLLPINIIEAASSWSGDIRLWSALTLFPLLFIDKVFMPEYILICLLSDILFIISSRIYSHIEKLRNENELLTDKNEMLYTRLNMEMEYENQLKYLVQLEERNSLAQRIHDNVGHTIAGSLIQLEAACAIIDKDKAKAKDMVGNVVKNLRIGMEDIRSTLRSIKPAPEQLGINRLKAMLDEFTAKNSIKTILQCKNKTEVITQKQWLIITENIREALTNTLKYASASEVNVDIEVMNKLIRVEIHNNGLPAQTIQKGLGIAGMEERTESVGGKLIIDGSRGFSVITLLPIENA